MKRVSQTAGGKDPSSYRICLQEALVQMCHAGGLVSKSLISTEPNNSSLFLEMEVTQSTDPSSVHGPYNSLGISYQLIA